MAVRRSIVLLCVLSIVIGGSAVFGDESRRGTRPPQEVLEAVASGEMSEEVLQQYSPPSMSPAQLKSLVGSPLVEMGFVSLWWAGYRNSIGSFEDDLLGDAAHSAPCGYVWVNHDESGQYFTLSPNIVAGAEGAVSLSYWEEAYDSDTCQSVVEDNVRYYMTQVKVLEPTQATLMVGADDGVQVWLNDTEVVSHEGVAEYTEGQHQAEVSLEQGWNLLVVKLHYPLFDVDKRWSLRFEDADGSPLHLIQAYDGWCSEREGTYGWTYAGGLASLAGAHGSNWRSDLRFLNPYPFPLELTVDYYAEGNVVPAKNQGADPASKVAVAMEPTASRMVVIDPYGYLFWEDALAALGVAGGKGMVSVRGLYYNDVQNYGAARLSTFNQADAGTFGTQIPLTYYYRGSGSVTLVGLRNGPDWRTNIGGVPRFAHDDQVTFTVAVWDPESGATAERSFVGQGYFQINNIFGALGLGAMVTDTAMAEITWTSTENNAYFEFYASVNDNGTSDPNYISMAPNGYVPPGLAK